MPASYEDNLPEAPLASSAPSVSRFFSVSEPKDVKDGGAVKSYKSKYGPNAVDETGVRGSFLPALSALPFPNALPLVVPSRP